MVELEPPRMPQLRSPCNSRRSNDSNSPEFEFWPSFPQPDLHSADELFSGGVLLPLHQLHHQTTSSDPPPPPPTPQEEETGQLEYTGNDSTRPGTESMPTPDLSAAITNLSASGFTSSKRWKDIFKKSDKKCSNNGNDDVIDDTSKEKVKEKVRKKEKRNLGVGGGGGVTTAELNIYLWPFRRTRSAGNGGNRPRPSSTAATTRKVSSAPCSRSNSAGESKSRKWPSSPSRGGVHLGRSSPIWQVRRPTTTPSRSLVTSGKSAEKGTRKDGNDSGRNIPAAGTGGAASSGGGSGQKGKILNLSVPMCIGYRSQLSCRSDENSGVSVATAASGGVSGGGGGSMEGVRGGNLFNIRSLFTKKVY